MANLILILGNQLTTDISTLEGGSWNFDADNPRMGMMYRNWDK